MKMFSLVVLFSLSAGHGYGELHLTSDNYGLDIGQRPYSATTVSEAVKDDTNMFGCGN